MLLLGLCACSTTTEVIAWAPDGRRAMVHGSDGVYLVNENGEITARLPGSSLSLPVWLPDSRRVAAVRETPARNWREYAAVLGPDRAHAIKTAATELLPLVRRHRGQWKDWENEPATKQWASEHPKAELAAAVYYLEQQHSGEVGPRLKAWREKASFGATIYQLIVRDAGLAPAERERVLFRSAASIYAIHPSPNGKELAFVLSWQGAPALEAISVEGGEPIEVVKGARDSAWTADGRQLAFAKIAGDDGEVSAIEIIGRRPICGQDGRLLPKAPEVDWLAETTLSAASWVACWPDGRLVFAAPDAHLPLVCATNGEPEEAKLFVLRPESPQSVERLLNDEAEKLLPPLRSWFIANPAKTQIAIPGRGGELSIVNVATREVTVLQRKVANFGEEKPDDKTKLEMVVPCWRTDDEICYAIPAGAPEGSPKRAELVLQKIGGPRRAISKTWPDAMVKGILLPSEADSL